MRHHETCDMGFVHEVIICTRCGNKITNGNVTQLIPPLGSFDAAHPAEICIDCVDAINVHIFHLPENFGHPREKK